jgi:hypothetical protein
MFTVKLQGSYMTMPGKNTCTNENQPVKISTIKPKRVPPEKDRPPKGETDRIEPLQSEGREVKEKLPPDRKEHGNDPVFPKNGDRPKLPPPEKKGPPRLPVRGI